MQDCPVWHPFQHRSGKLTGWSHEELTFALRDHVSADYEVMVDFFKNGVGFPVHPFSAVPKTWAGFRSHSSGPQSVWRVLVHDENTLAPQE